MPQPQSLRCTCGKICVEVAGAPIASVECHCNSCRAAAARLQSLPGAPRYQETNGGTRFVLYRKDRVRFLKGRNLLRSFRLDDNADTRRVVATCCRTPILLEFKNGHWLSLYAGLWEPDARPALEMRTMTSDLPDPSVLDDDVPNLRRQSGRFFARLLGAWVAMGFRVPALRIEEERHV